MVWNRSPNRVRERRLAVVLPKRKRRVARMTPSLMSTASSLTGAVPPPFPPATVGRASRLCHSPLVLWSQSSGRMFYADPRNTKSSRCQFEGVVAQCREVLLEPESQDNATAAIARSPCGKVFVLRRESPPFALKVLRKDIVEAKAVRQGRVLGQLSGEDPWRELAALQNLNADGGHPHVEQLVEAIEDDEFLFKITPWCVDGEAFELIPLPEAQARRLIRQVLSALSFMHQRNVFHRDVSLENILIERSANGDQSARLGDMGMALNIPLDPQTGQRLPIAPQGRCGKPACISPELHGNAQPFDAVAADVWSSGSVLYMLLLGLSPWSCIGDSLFQVISVEGRLAPLLRTWGLSGRISPEAVDLLQCMLRADPAQRLATVEDVLAHPWFAGHGSNAGDAGNYGGGHDFGGGRGGRGSVGGVRGHHHGISNGGGGGCGGGGGGGGGAGGDSIDSVGATASFDDGSCGSGHVLNGGGGSSSGGDFMSYGGDGSAGGSSSGGDGWNNGSGWNGSSEDGETSGSTAGGAAAAVAAAHTSAAGGMDEEIMFGGTP
ncbi:unnamed protein product [Phaeothamnion confervicola]